MTENHLNRKLTYIARKINSVKSKMVQPNNKFLVLGAPIMEEPEISEKNRFYRHNGKDSDN